MHLATWISIAALAAGLLWLLPRPGAVNGRWRRRPPVIDDPRIGRSRGLPFAMRFRVDAAATGFPGGIGRIVHGALFPGRPGFTFNVVFACARPDWRGRSGYADPRSIWHGVFAGYFQIDVAQAEWGRPFAYDLDADGRSSVRLDELARVVQADWNHFSNQLYGVPARAIAPVDALDAGAFRGRTAGRVRDEGWDGAWDVAEFDEITVVSPYSANGGRDYEDRDPIVGRLWRLCFGTSVTRAGAESFPPTRMKMKAYMCFRPDVDSRGVPVWRTFVFGATINLGYDVVDPAENARFLDLQLRSIEALIAAERGLGFTETEAEAEAGAAARRLAAG